MCLIEQFTSTSEGDVNHPTVGHKTKFHLGGSGVPVTRTHPTPYKYHPAGDHWAKYEKMGYVSPVFGAMISKNLAALVEHAVVQ